MNPSQKIFISYRNGDGAYSARLWDHLIREFGEENVFFDKDRDSIPLASAFPQVLEAAVQGAEILLAVIGPGWISAESLRRIVEQQDDWVRRELLQAMNRREAGEKIEVLPLLVGGVSMPEPSQLPPELAGFSVIQAPSLGELIHAYDEDIKTLIDLIHVCCPDLRARRQNGWMGEALESSDQSMARFSQDIAVRAPGRQPIKRLAAQSALDAWWGGWAGHRQTCVLLGEEGDGKSWAVADWLADQLEGGNFAVPIVFAPALKMASASVDDILAACLGQAQPAPPEGWLKRLHEIAKGASGAAPLFLLVVDALNERTSLDWQRTSLGWRELFDTIRVSPWRECVALLVLCRSPYWAHLNIPDDGRTVRFTLPPFNEAELDQALAQRQSTRRVFASDVLHLMSRPRYFDLAFRLADQVEEGGLTLERLIYEDWRDITARKRHHTCSHDEFQALIADLADQYEDRLFSINEFAQKAPGLGADARALRYELSSVGVLASQGSRLAITLRYLPLALGLVLASEVEDSGANAAPAALAETITKRIGPHREADLQVRICGMALFHALNSEGYPEAGRLALLRAWVEGVT